VAAEAAVRKKKAPKRSGGGQGGAATSGDSLITPMQGTIVKIAVEEGQVVEAGELVVVLEAMKMEQPINAHKAGTITGLTATVGLTVANGLVIAEIKD
jgi:acetyl-CoA/propionyl-CoA carboxylase biotin carboxyl carrier protein